MPGVALGVSLFTSKTILTIKDLVSQCLASAMRYLATCTARKTRILGTDSSYKYFIWLCCLGCFPKLLLSDLSLLAQFIGQHPQIVRQHAPRHL
jgi:hypothetical protein